MNFLERKNHKNILCTFPQNQIIQRILIFAYFLQVEHKSTFEWRVKKEESNYKKNMNLNKKRYSPRCYGCYNNTWLTLVPNSRQHFVLFYGSLYHITHEFQLIYLRKLRTYAWLMESIGVSKRRLYQNSHWSFSSVHRWMVQALAYQLRHPCQGGQILWKLIGLFSVSKKLSIPILKGHISFELNKINLQSGTSSESNSLSWTWKLDPSCLRIENFQTDPELNNTFSTLEN